MLKNKTLPIDKDLHESFKTFCKNKGFKMKPLLEDLIRTYINKYEDLEEDYINDVEIEKTYPEG